MLYSTHLYLTKRSSFELFKSSACHHLKEMGDLDFIMDVLKSREIRTYYDRGWYPESLYLLAMLDYVSRLNGLPLCSEYDNLRRCRLEKPLYPANVLAICAASKDDRAMIQAERDAIHEFKRFNIIECEVRNAVRKNCFASISFSHPSARKTKPSIPLYSG